MHPPFRVPAVACEVQQQRAGGPPRDPAERQRRERLWIEQAWHGHHSPVSEEGALF